MYLQRKNQHFIFILSVLFCSETERDLFLALLEHLSEQNQGFVMNFKKNVPHNITWKWECRPGT
jgi:hypothetical protein